MFLAVESLGLIGRILAGFESILTAMNSSPSPGHFV
jgi:hypothetical protein